MRHEDIETFLARLEESNRRQQAAIEKLQAASQEIAAALTLLDHEGRAKKSKRPRTSGRGVTTAELAEVVAQLRSTQPDTTVAELTEAATNHFRRGGKSLQGFSMRLRKVLGENS